MVGAVRIELLGGLRVSRHGAALAGHLPRKATALVAYLAVTGRPQPRGRLATLLRHGAAPAAARVSRQGA